MPVIDSQVHAYAANTAERPWHKKEPVQPVHVTGDEMVAAMDKVGVDGAILVSPFGIYNYDGSYAVECQRAHPGRFALVKPADPYDPAAAEVVAEWKKVPGAVGLRVMIVRRNDPNSPGIPNILRAAARADLAINLQCGGKLEDGMALIDRHPETRFVIDHLGFYQPRVKPAPAGVWDDLPKVLELARRPNVAIKVSGVCTMSREAYPHEDLWEPLARVFDAWGLERCLWGTDWTRTYSLPVSYQEAVDTFRLSTRLSASERAMLMGGACAKAYRWEPKKA